MAFDRGGALNPSGILSRTQSRRRAQQRARQRFRDLSWREPVLSAEEVQQRNTELKESVLAALTKAHSFAQLGGVAAATVAGAHDAPDTSRSSASKEDGAQRTAGSPRTPPQGASTAAPALSVPRRLRPMVRGVLLLRGSFCFYFFFILSDNAMAMCTCALACVCVCVCVCVAVYFEQVRTVSSWKGKKPSMGVGAFNRSVKALLPTPLPAVATSASPEPTPETPSAAAASKQMPSSASSRSQRQMRRAERRKRAHSAKGVGSHLAGGKAGGKEASQPDNSHV